MSETSDSASSASLESGEETSIPSEAHGVESGGDGGGDEVASEDGDFNANKQTNLWAYSVHVTPYIYRQEDTTVPKGLEQLGWVLEASGESRMYPICRVFKQPPADATAPLAPPRPVGVVYQDGSYTLNERMRSRVTGVEGKKFRLRQSEDMYASCRRDSSARRSERKREARRNARKGGGAGSSVVVSQPSETLGER